MDEYSICGIDCIKCEYKEQVGCKGCRESHSKMFWGECVISKCAQSKDLEHCGLCPQFPCDQLNAFAYDKEQGDNGQRIKNLKKLISK